MYCGGCAAGVVAARIARIVEILGCGGEDFRLLAGNVAGHSDAAVLEIVERSIDLVAETVGQGEGLSPSRCPARRYSSGRRRR